MVSLPLAVILETDSTPEIVASLVNTKEKLPAVADPMANSSVFVVSIVKL